MRFQVVIAFDFVFQSTAILRPRSASYMVKPNESLHDRKKLCFSNVQVEAPKCMHIL